MRIVLNGIEEELGNERMSVSEMLALKKYTFRMRIVKINDVLVARDKYDSTFIHEGDNVQMIYLMSGG
jgi:thiamine biosynthesis protein ThiS